MRLKDFNYHLPETAIAYYPAKNRTDARLLCLDGQTGDITHRVFSDIIDCLSPGDLLVFNKTRVIPARLHGYKNTGGKVEVLVERIIDDHTILAHIRSSKSPKAGARLRLEERLELEIIAREDDLFRCKSHAKEPILSIIDEIGHMPLPPYIKRKDEALDRERYQTVYAAHAGSVAAPTAGLHFDDALMKRLKDKGIDQAFLMLHVGAGTFQPVRTDNIEDHQIHAEYIEVSEDVCEKIRATKARGGRVVAVGTTSTRALESASLSGEIQPYAGETNIYIYPGFKFHCVDAMITNFHLPESSLLILVSAFAGHAHVMHAYREAVEKHYRFYSYGDAMFVTRCFS